MSDIVDIKDAIEKRDGPDPEYKYRDDYGVWWYVFSASYQDGEKTYSLNFWATSQEDAERRIDLMKRSMVYDGQIMSVVDG